MPRITPVTIEHATETTRPLLDGVQKKLQEASNKIEETGKRTRVLTRKLRDVEALPNTETQQLLGLALDDELDDDA